jgi:hypothetical protein
LLVDGEGRAGLERPLLLRKLPAPNLSANGHGRCAWLVLPEGWLIAP